MAVAARLFWRLLPDVREGERSRFLFFAGLFTLVSLAQMMGLAGSEALFLAEYGAEGLPLAIIAASLTTVVLSIFYALRVGSVRNDVLFIRWLSGTSIGLVALAAGLATGRTWVLPILFCTWYFTQAIFTNHFWTFSNDYFDSLSSKRLVPRFTIGASLGGALGGGIAALLADLLGPLSLVVGWAAALAGAAAMLRAARRPLRRWGPLELEESDETSMEGIQGALRFVRSSSLARWLVLSALGMVLSLFLAQYLYSDVFSRTFPDPARLALFLSVFLAVTNAIEILFEAVLTPWLIRRIGVPGANLVHPVVMLTSFVGLGVSYQLPAAIGARVSRELVENALAAPVRSLIQNAAPARFRGRMRAFLEGIVVYGGMSLAGVLLFLVREPQPLWLCFAGGVAALLYLAANWRARRAYLATLVEQLRTGRLDVQDVGDAIGGWEASRLAGLWEDALREEGLRPSASLLQLVPALAARGVIDPLVRAASHPNADVRRSCINALAALGGQPVAGPLGLALDDPDPGVRLAALRGLARLEGDPAFVVARLGELLQDQDPRVRAEAALRAGPDGLETLEKMIESSRNDESVAALAVAPRSLLATVTERARVSAPEVRAAALECLARISVDPPLPSEELVGCLRDPDPRVRRAAVLLLANFEDEEALAALAGCLTDPAPEVQFAAETVLGSLGADGIGAVEPYLASDVERAVEGALRVVATAGGPDARTILLYELRRRVRELWYDLVVYQRLPKEDSLTARFLRATYRDAMMRERRLSFKVLEVLENPTVIRKVDRAMRAGNRRARADALMVLSNLGDREASELLVLVHETAPLEERVRALAGIVRVPETLPEILGRARQSEVRWIRMAAEAYDPQEGAPPPEEERMERLLALKRVDLFHNLSLEQLDAVHRVTKEAEYLPNEVICREGEPGNMLFLLLEGRVRVIKDYGTSQAIQLSTMEAIVYFGEMAILDDEPRSATVVALTPARLLTLDGASLKELILQMPDISFEIFRVLTGRIRLAEKRLSKS